MQTCIEQNLNVENFPFISRHIILRVLYYLYFVNSRILGSLDDKSVASPIDFISLKIHLKSSNHFAINHAESISIPWFLLVYSINFDHLALLTFQRAKEPARFPLQAVVKSTSSLVNTCPRSFDDVRLDREANTLELTELVNHGVVKKRVDLSFRRSFERRNTIRIESTAVHGWNDSWFISERGWYYTFSSDNLPRSYMFSWFSWIFKKAVLLWDLWTNWNVR